jgi:small subunit ribosomal protein S33
MSMSEYARRMGILSARIFGDVVRPTNNRSMKVVQMFAAKPNHKNEEVCEYYPRHNQIFWIMYNLRKLGLYRLVFLALCMFHSVVLRYTFRRDEHWDFKQETKRKKALRGKTKPKKGEGKRAQKKK